jgi:predicted DCC family thiol-disulfide oxidoreductase YuxK
VRRDTCYFDGQCGMCQGTVRWLRRLDWLGRLDYRDMTRVPATELPVPIGVALTGMPMRTRSGGVLVGFPAVRRALLQTPLGALAAWLLYLPGVSTLGRRAYGWVARNRRRTSCATAEPGPLGGTAR